MWNQHGSLVLFTSVLDTQCFYNQSKSYANFISAAKSQNSIEHQSAALTRGRINMNKTQHGIPFQISFIHEAPQPSVHAERPASSPVGHLPGPGNGQHQKAPPVRTAKPPKPTHCTSRSQLGDSRPPNWDPLTRHTRGRRAASR